MNKSAFLKLIQQASHISDQQTEELEKMADAFPYCQTAHLLLAKSAYDKGSMLSAQRLRRAASYATNRQLLKRVIYTSPAEPVFEEVAAQQETVTLHAAASAEPVQVVPVLEEHFTEAEPATETESITEPTYAEEVQEDVEVYEDAVIIEDETEHDPVQPEPVQETDASESELLSLLTISSLSTSFTDLLAQAPDPEAEVSIPLRNTAQVEEFNITAEVPQEEAINETVNLTAETTGKHTTDFEEEPAPVLVEQHAEDAQINYATDEIDRLYAEDALGYWMSSSRMGEQLLLKNEYTRPKPQSFHPELILEYNKTHELEKAIQPAANILSNQLDIIDQFLKLNPRLKTMANLKMKEEPQEDLSLKSSKIKKGLASENLATIFLKQGKVKKAIKIYEHLILKNPEKKTYFAEQIEKLQNQI